MAHWRTAARRLTTFAVLAVALVILAGFFEDRWWVFHLLVHFPLQLAFALVVLLALALVLRMPLVATLAGLCLLAQVPALTWSYGGGAAAATAPLQSELPLVVTTFNMGSGRVDEPAFLAYLDAKDPDILLIQESYSIPNRLLRELAARFPHFGPGLKLRRSSRMIFSRFPVKSAHRIRVQRRVSFLVFGVDLGPRDATVITLHAPNPTTNGGFEARNRLFAALAENLSHYHLPIIVAGDFNTTPWSRYFAQLLEKTGLRDASEGRGWTATWPARLGGLGIGIDHILVSDDVKVVWSAPGRNMGSDHRPITAWLKLRY